MRTTVSLCVAVVAALAIVGCGGSREVHSSDVAHKVKSALTAKVGKAPKSVTCPHDLDARVGATLTCKLTADDGTWLYVYVRVDRVSGDRAHFKIRASTKVHRPGH